MKLTEKQMGKIASDMRHAYDYMDNMPLDGWIWEFVRRNEEYKKSYSEALSEYIEWIKETGKSAGKNSRIRWVMYRRFLDKINKENWSRIFPKLIPDPRLGYNNIHESAKPLISGPIKGGTYQELKQALEDIRESLATMISIQKEEWTIEKMLERHQAYILEELLPSDQDDACFIAISRTARKDDLKSSVEKIISAYIKKMLPRAPQFRKDQWRHYLEIYDLHGQVERSIIAEKYFPHLLNVRPDYRRSKEVDKYYRKAKALINHGYKKYL